MFAIKRKRGILHYAILTCVDLQNLHIFTTLSSEINITKYLYINESQKVKNSRK